MCLYEKVICGLFPGTVSVSYSMVCVSVGEVICGLFPGTLSVSYCMVCMSVREGNLWALVSEFAQSLQ